MPLIASIRPIALGTPSLTVFPTFGILLYLVKTFLKISTFFSTFTMARTSISSSFHRILLFQPSLYSLGYLMVHLSSILHLNLYLYVHLILLFPIINLLFNTLHLKRLLLYLLILLFISLIHIFPYPITFSI